MQRPYYLHLMTARRVIGSTRIISGSIAAPRRIVVRYFEPTAPTNEYASRHKYRSIQRPQFGYVRKAPGSALSPSSWRTSRTRTAGAGILAVVACDRPAAGRPAQRGLARIVTRLFRDGPPTATFHGCRPGSGCAMGAFAATVAEERLQDSFHAARSSRSKNCP